MADNREIVDTREAQRLSAGEIERLKGGGEKGDT